MSFGTLDSFMVPTLPVSKHKSTANMSFRMLKKFVAHPLHYLLKKAQKNDPRIVEMAKIREAIQRAFTKAKKDNAEDYKKYILHLVNGGIADLPPIRLYIQQKLTVKTREDGTSFLFIPPDALFVPIDGETQLTAWYKAAEVDPKVLDWTVEIAFYHDIPLSHAQQFFHDHNRFGVGVAASLAMARDGNDPATDFARRLTEANSFLRLHKVNWEGRQLSKKMEGVVTGTTLRGFILAALSGLKAANIGAKPFRDENGIFTEQAYNVLVEILEAWTSNFGNIIVDRKNYVAHTNCVWAAIGAAFHPIVKIEDDQARKREISNLIQSMHQIDWKKGMHWNGIAGKVNPKGEFSSQGMRETMGSCFRAISDHADPGYGRIRIQRETPQTFWRAGGQESSPAPL